MMVLMELSEFLLPVLSQMNPAKETAPVTRNQQSPNVRFSLIDQCSSSGQQSHSEG